VTKVAKSRDAEKKGRERAIFGDLERTAVNRAEATTLENKGKIRHCSSSENGV
jgi:hypothetical protein